jgi:hypothetical protein
VVLADVAVLLHVAAGLAQKPDRGAVDGLAQAGADKAAAVENGLATLLNGEYDCVEAPPGTVVVSGTSKMYYGPSVIMSSAAAITDAQKKENERIRFEAEAGKTYYMRWTSGMFASGIKLTPVDEATGAKEMSKLHVSKPPEAKPDEKQEAK